MMLFLSKLGVALCYLCLLGAICAANDPGEQGSRSAATGLLLAIPLFRFLLRLRSQRILRVERPSTLSVFYLHSYRSALGVWMLFLIPAAVLRLYRGAEAAGGAYGAGIGLSLFAFLLAFDIPRRLYTKHSRKIEPIPGVPPPLPPVISKKPESFAFLGNPNPGWMVFFFFVVASLIYALTQSANSTTKVAEKAQLNRLEKIRSKLDRDTAVEMQRQIDEKGYIDGLPAESEKRTLELKAGVEQLSGPYRQMAEAGLRIQQSLNISTRQYNDSVEKIIKVGGFYDPVSLPTLESIHERKRMVHEIGDANFALQTRIANLKTICRQEMKTVDANEATRELAMEILLKKMQVDTLLEIRLSDKKLCESSLIILGFLEESFGQWEIKEGRPYFTKDSDVEKYNALVAEIHGVAQQQEVLQRRFVQKQLENNRAETGQK